MKSEPNKPAATLFSPELRTASFIKRWNIVWMAQPDNVAEHSYYVALYARFIADTIKWKGNKGTLLTLALLDDIDEIVTGDITGPVKHEILDQKRTEEFVDSQLVKKMPLVVDLMADLAEEDKNGDMYRIIKCADKMDALVHLIVQSRLGSKHLKNRIDDSERKLEAAWRDLPADEALLSKLWQTKISPAIGEHFNTGGDGVW